MRTVSARRGSSGLLLAAAGALAVFLAFGALHWRLARETRFTPDEELLAELGAATLDDPGSPLADAGWPQWRGPRRDGIAAGRPTLAEWPERGPALLWKKPIGEGYASFAAGDGRLYTLVREDDQECVLCWNAADGAEVWRYAYPCVFRNDYGSGPRGTPALANGKLYTVGSLGLMHCLDAADGSVLWQHDLIAEFDAPLPQWGVSFSPLVDGNLVFAMPGGPNGGSLAAFDRETGQLAWQSQDDPPGYGSPIAVTLGGVRQAIFFTGTHVVGVNAATGHLLWRYSWPTFTHANTATPITFSARSAGRELDYVFVSSGYGKGCVLLKIEPTGAGGFRARPVYEGTQMRNHFASSVLWQGYLYGFDETALVCLDIKTGERLWRQTGFQKGCLLIANGQLVVLGERGDLALADASPEEWKERGRFRPFRTHRCWSLPIVVDGKLIVRDLDQVMAFDIRAE